MQNFEEGELVTVKKSYRQLVQDMHIGKGFGAEKENFAKYLRWGGNAMIMKILNHTAILTNCSNTMEPKNMIVLPKVFIEHFPQPVLSDML